jgi:putative NADH-flavin reductase
MEAANIRRIVVLGSAGALDSALDKQAAWRRWLVENVVYRTMLKWPVASQRAQVAALEASRLDWTMVMPPMLVNWGARSTYRVDGDALPRGAAMIARADVADFMMLQLKTQEWVRKGVYVSW